VLWQDVEGLRDLLGHLDDIDDIFQAVGREVVGRTITLSEFKAIVHAHPSAKYMHQVKAQLPLTSIDWLHPMDWFWCLFKVLARL
jgi:hypothetical protein